MGAVPCRAVYLGPNQIGWLEGSPSPPVLPLVPSFNKVSWWGKYGCDGCRHVTMDGHWDFLPSQFTYHGTRVFLFPCLLPFLCTHIPYYTHWHI